MLKTLGSDRATVPLPDLGAVRVQGVDALRFLQGQLSNDTQRLTAERSQLAGLHTAQGRVIALLRLMLVAPDDLIAVLPRELAAPVATRLAKYVLRAKAKVSDASADWTFHGLMDATRTDVHSQARDEDSFVVCVAPGRCLAAKPSGTAPTTPSQADAGLREQWRALDIADGIPQVYTATSEAFVAQMLNLDVLGAIAFDKGCYTGQEIIARAHYRGRVKRRMQRFRTVGAATIAAGDTQRLHDGRAAQVVHAVQLSDGRFEFLAVAPSGSGEEPSDAAVPTGTVGDLQVESLSLPYELPA